MSAAGALYRSRSISGAWCLDSALAYAARGWPVFPLAGRTKVPIRGSRGHLDATCDPETIRAWWTRYPEASVAIATGGVSGLVVLDIDPRHGGDDTLADLEAAHGPLPETVESLTGGGGRHLLYGHSGGHVPSRPDALGPGVDIRADGGYIVAPPSIHPSGQRYAWEISSHPDHVEVAPLPGWVRELCYREGRNDIVSVLSVTSASLSVTDEGTEQRIEAAIRRTTPEYEGQRHNRVFAFCRALRSIPGVADADRKQLKDIVRRWHKAALPIIRTKAFDPTWNDFNEGWTKVRHPEGAGPMAEAIERTDTNPPPPIAQEYDTTDTIRLICLCRELQREAGSQPFYLSCRTAAEVLEVDRMKVWRTLNMLKVDEVIVEVEPGTKTKAARYRYVAD